MKNNKRGDSNWERKDYVQHNLNRWWDNRHNKNLR